MEALRETGVTTMAGLAQALSERGVPTPRGSSVWTHTTVARVLSRVDSLPPMTAGSDAASL